MGLAVSMMAEERWRDILMAEESNSFVRAVKCVRADRCITCVLSAGMGRARVVDLPSWHRVQRGISASVRCVLPEQTPTSCAFVMLLV